MIKYNIRLGFSIVELFVVVGLIGVLISLALPAIQHIRSAADKVSCQNNLRQCAIAIHHYHSDHHRVPKPARRNPWQTDPSLLLSNLTYLLPYIEQDAAFQNAIVKCQTGARPWQNPPHDTLRQLIKVYTCPADSRLSSVLTDDDGISAAYGSYLPCSGSGFPNGDGIFGVHAPRFQGATFASVYDGLSNTFMIGERPPPDTLQAGKWYPSQTTTFGKYGILVGPDDSLSIHQNPLSIDPCGDRFWYGPGRTDNPCDRYHFWSFHPRGSFFAFGDASVRWVPYSTAREILTGLATKGSGEAVVIPE